MKKILITGANGRVGKALVNHLDLLGEKYEITLADISLKDPRGIEFDITDLDACRRAFSAQDCVIHLAGVASPDASFDKILPSNIIGTHNIFQAAMETGVNRVIYASSAQTIEGYPTDVQVRADMPTRPKNLYGVSKVYGEALANYFAYQHGLEAIAVRIGAFEYPHEWEHLDTRDLSAWSEPGDISSLFVDCLKVDMTNNPFFIAHAISDNKYKRLDITDTKNILGYSPKSDSFTTWGITIAEDSKPRKV